MRRIASLDELRGLLILFVVLYHLLYDISLFFPESVGKLWILWPEYSILRAVFPGLFIFLCGISCHLSHNNLRRGLICAGFATAITLLSLLVTPDYPIRFGILHLLAVCILLFIPLKRLTRGFPDWLAILLFIALFFFTWGLPYGMIGGNIALPQQLWNRDGLFILGFPSDRIFSADYFPLMPWGFLFAAGSFAGRGLAEGRAPSFFYHSRSAGMAKIGRHTMLIYLLHQPVWFGVLTLLKVTR